MLYHLQTYLYFDVVHLLGQEDRLADFLGCPLPVSYSSAVGLLTAIIGGQRAVSSYMASDDFLEAFAAMVDGHASLQGEYTAREFFATSRMPHGIHESPQRIYAFLHRLFPLVQLPSTMVRDLVEECAFRSNVRRGLDVRLPRNALSTLPAEGHRALDSDWSPVSPTTGVGGSTEYYVMVFAHSKLCIVVPRPVKTVGGPYAAAIFLLACTSGTMDDLCSDRVSDTNNKINNYKQLAIRLFG